MTARPTPTSSRRKWRWPWLTRTRRHSPLGVSVLNSLFIDAEKAAETIRGNGALSWADHDHSLFDGTEWFFRTGYREGLPVWINALDGVSDVLHAGGSIADIGCGHGAAVVVLADLYPEATLTGFDFHGPSVETAKERAAEAGVSDGRSVRRMPRGTTAAMT